MCYIYMAANFVFADYGLLKLKQELVRGFWTLIKDAACMACMLTSLFYFLSHTIWDFFVPRTSILNNNTLYRLLPPPTTTWIYSLFVFACQNEYVLLFSKENTTCSNFTDVILGHNNRLALQKNNKTFTSIRVESSSWNTKKSISHWWCVVLCGLWSSVIAWAGFTIH